jgi:hypothetical protein
MESKSPEGLSIASIEFKVQLYTITNAVVVQSKVILEWTFTLSLQHDLMRLATNTRCNHSLECFCAKSQYFPKTTSGYTKTLTNGITAQARNSGLGAQTIIDIDNNHGFLTTGRSNNLGLLLLLLILGLVFLSLFFSLVSSSFTSWRASPVTTSLSVSITVFPSRRSSTIAISIAITSG